MCAGLKINIVFSYNRSVTELQELYGCWAMLGQKKNKIIGIPMRLHLSGCNECMYNYCAYIHMSAWSI